MANAVHHTTAIVTPKNKSERRQLHINTDFDNIITIITLLLLINIIKVKLPAATESCVHN